MAPRQIPARYYLFLRLQSITCLKFNKSIFKKMEVFLFSFLNLNFSFEKIQKNIFFKGQIF